MLDCWLRDTLRGIRIATGEAEAPCVVPHGWTIFREASLEASVQRIVAAATERPLVVGAMMKLSRQASLCHSGVLHLWPEDGVMYMPVDPATGVSAPGMNLYRAVLLKATDYLDADKGTRAAVYNRALNGVRRYPAVIEAFHNHGGVQLKCYAIDGHVFIKLKPSFPDVRPEHAAADGSSVQLDGEHRRCCHPYVFRFHSLDNMPICSTGTEQQERMQNDLTAHECAAQDAATAIAFRTGLRLFGFDLIVGRGTAAQYTLIDVNAFPSFRGLDEAPGLIRACVKRVVNTPMPVADDDALCYDYM